MEFCGRCGTRLGRGPERGRFCRACGHETPGNARYPLYADGTAAVTRPRPASVSQQPAATAVVPRVRTQPVAQPAPAPAVAEAADVTRPRLASVDATSVSLFAATSSAPPAGASLRSGASWAVAVAVTLAAMAVVVLLGLVLLTH